MVGTNNDGVPANSDRKTELEAFDNTRAGVKGLVDAGVVKIPRFFVHDQPVNDHKTCLDNTRISIPVINMIGIDKDQVVRARVIEEIKDACENWGFFQVVNHGVPESVCKEMMEGVRRFFEQDTEAKKKYYSRDFGKPFLYNSNFDLYQSSAANWRDTFQCVVAPHPLQPEEIPSVCREIIFEYSSYIKKLGVTLLELFSEALGLKPDHLKDMQCGEGLLLLGHYYPSCPEPELTMGTSNHTDSGFFTILLQDLLGGLQVLHENHWVDVPSFPGALVINIADLLQLISNDRFKSVNHRVLARSNGPRISIATFFRTHFGEGNAPRSYGPIKELLSEKNLPVYRDVPIEEYLKLRYTKGLDGTSSLSPFKVA